MSETPRVVDVAVGVINDPDGRVLVNQRVKGKTFAGRWEFPGGKIKVGETVAQALTRELSEELGIKVDRQRPLISFTHDYEALSVRLHVNEVLAYQGVPIGREGQALKWMETGRLRYLDLLCANATIVTAIVLPRICLITDTRRFGMRQTFELLGRHVERQRILVVVREKEMERTRLASFVRGVTEICRKTDSLVCVHADCAFDEYENVDGIHFPARILETSAALDGTWLVGVSCHSDKEIELAHSHGAHYVFLSPVKQTGSHPTTVPLGWRQFAKLCTPALMPVFALGGLQMADLKNAIEHGAQGVAVLSAGWSHGSGSTV